MCVSNPNPNPNPSPNPSSNPNPDSSIEKPVSEQKRPQFLIKKLSFFNYLSIFYYLVCLHYTVAYITFF